MHAFHRHALCGALAVALSACASIPRDAGVEALGERVVARVDAAPSSDPSAVAAWLGEPLTPASATRIALARNPQIALRFAQLGLARADLMDAASIANPTLSLSFLDMTGGGQQITRGLGQPLLDLLLQPARRRLGEADFAAARDEAAQAIVDLALDVETQWFNAVAARQLADLRAVEAELLDAGAELAQRYADAGNLAAAELAVQRALAAEHALAAAQATEDARRERRTLQTLLGLDDDEFRLPSRLPRIAVADPLPDDLAALAATQRLDLAVARGRIARQQDALRLAQHWRLLGTVDLGYERESDPGGERLRGPTLALALPLFNQGQAGIERASAELALTQAALAQASAQVAQDVDAARSMLASHRAAVRLRLDQLLPAHARNVAGLQEQQNWMLIGPFQLIAGRAAQFAAWGEHIEAVRDYWLARIGLRRAVGGAMPTLAGPLPAPLTLPPDDLLLASSPTEPAANHQGHGEQP